MRKQFYAIFCLIQIVVIFSMAYGQIDYDERNGMFVNFDDDNYSWARWDCASPNTAQMSEVDNPDPGGINTSARVGRFLTSTCTYEGAYCTAKFKPIDFSEKAIFKIKVMAPDEDLVFLFKLEDYTDGQIFYEVNATTTTYNEWEELSFDFSGAPSNVYQKIVVLPDFGGEYENYWYFDDIRLTDQDDTEVVHSASVIKSCRLAQNYPNPFNPNTTIHYSIEKPSRVQIKIYDESGRLIKGLVDENKPAGDYSSIWDGRNQQGEFVSSGRYFYALKVDDIVITKRMILLK